VADKLLGESGAGSLPERRSGSDYLALDRSRRRSRGESQRIQPGVGVGSALVGTL